MAGGGWGEERRFWGERWWGHLNGENIPPVWQVHVRQKKNTEAPHHLQTEVISEQEISNPFHSTMPYGDSYLACVIMTILWWSGLCGKILIAHSLKWSFGLKKKTNRKKKNDHLRTSVTAFLDSLLMECRWKALKFQAPLCNGHR